MILIRKQRDDRESSASSAGNALEIVVLSRKRYLQSKKENVGERVLSLTNTKIETNKTSGMLCKEAQFPKHKQVLSDSIRVMFVEQCTKEIGE